MFTLFVICPAVVWMCAVHSIAGNVQGYRSFEEYLEHVMSGDALLDDDYSDDDSLDDISSAAASNELLGYFRTIPREHWSCCMLGILAGSKGFHCQAQYYSSSADAAGRNVNRAQTARQPGVHGRHRQRVSPRWGYGIARSFHRCVDDSNGPAESERSGGEADQFHSCCYAATEERRELRRARRHRSHRRAHRRR